MSGIRPALISRIYKAIDQRRLSDAVLLLTQLFDGVHSDPEAQSEHFLSSLRELGDELQETGKLFPAEEHYALGLALYDRFFPQMHYEGIASARRLSDVYVAQGREADLARALDHAYLIVQRMSAAQAGERSIARQGSIADSLTSLHRVTMVAQGAAVRHAKQLAGGSSRPIRVLLVEDSADDAGLVQETLSSTDSLSVVTEWAEHLNEGVERVAQGGVDVVLLDLSLPDSHALETLLKMHNSAPEVPIVVLTGIDDKELAVRALSNGARDYLLKGRADGAIIVRSIIAAVEEHFAELPKPRKQTSLESVAALITHSPLPSMYLSNEFVVKSANSALTKLLTLDPSGQATDAFWPEFRQQITLATEYGAGVQIHGVPLSDKFTHKGNADLTVWPTQDSEGLTDGLMVSMTHVAPLTAAPEGKMTSNQSLRAQLEQGKIERKELRDEIAQQTSLAKLSQIAQKGGTLEELFNAAVVEINAAFAPCATMLLQLNGSGNELVIAASEGIEAPDWRKFTNPAVSESLYAEALKTEDPIYYSQLGSSNLKSLVMSEFGFTAALLCTVPGDAQPFGILSVLFRGNHEMTPAESIFIAAAANILAVAVQRRLMETKLQQQTDALNRSNEDLQQFASAAAHDLQEPLRSVVSYLELLSNRMQGQLDEKAERYMMVSVSAAKRMQNLINDLLEYSRVTSRAKPVQPTDVNELLQYVLADLRLQIEESGALIEYDEMPVVEADSSQLAQVFQNLIANALKFRGDKAPHIRIGLAKTDAYWEFAISDNGIGLDMEYAERIFMIFQRLHSRREYSGTGIGLALCKKIIERHGGAIWVESKLGAGATFRFTLPR